VKKKTEPFNGESDETGKQGRRERVPFAYVLTELLADAEKCNPHWISGIPIPLLSYASPEFKRSE
jgi:hypothetical protein